MEAKYVTETVGDALTKGLAELVAAKPSDPVEYLANWLKQYRTNQIERERQKNEEQCENCGRTDHHEGAESTVAETQST